MPGQQAATLLARLDRLPVTRHMWSLIFALALGAFFEIYDLMMTAYVSPGLIAAGIFSAEKGIILGLPDQAAFASATFAGLWIGTLLLGQLDARKNPSPLRPRSDSLAALGGEFSCSHAACFRWRSTWSG